jgi:ribonuclease HII
VLPFQLLKTPLSPLARGVGGEGRGPRTLANLWPEAGAALRAANEPWYNADIDLPCQHPGDGVAAAAQTLRTACRGAGATFAAIRSVVVLPRQINALIAKHDSKAAVTLHALRQLLATLPEPRDDLPTAITVDKLGGRHYYHELLQECFEDVMILSRGESAERSVYHVCRREGACEVTFMPRAESESFAVALASMASKYLREVLMEQLNAYWQRQVPDLKPTAGYPGDAARFFADIAPTRERLGVDVALLWRVR